jgi:outer membrane lipoprotein SlyB
MVRNLMACGMALVLMAGCASVEESDVYSPEELSRLEDYKLVKVVHAEQVMVDPESPGLVGVGVGAASGGLIGSQVGGEGAAAALAILGGLIGYAIEQQATNTTATRYVVDVDGRQQVIVQKESEEPLTPGDMAMMIGDYEPRLVKAPQEIIDSAQQSNAASRTRVNQETGEILFDDELEPLRSQGQSQSQGETQPSLQQGTEGGSWVEPKANDQSEPVAQQ